MAWPHVGRYSWIGLKAESTWGTDPTGVDIWLPCVSETMAEKTNRVGRGTLAEGTSGSRVRRKAYIKDITVTGTIKVLVTFEGIGLLLKHWLWAVPADTGVPSTYTHVYKMATSPPAGGLTIECVRGDGNSTRYAGCRISKGTLEIEAGGILTLTLDIIGKLAASPTTATAVSAAASRDLTCLHHEAGAFTFNSASYTLSKATWVLDNKLAPRMLLGSLYTADPAISDYAESSVEFELEWANDALFAAHAAGTESDASITFTDGSARTLKIDVHNAYVDPVSNNVSAVGVVKQNGKFVGQDDGSDYGFAITTVNTQATGVDA